MPIVDDGTRDYRTMGWHVLRLDDNGNEFVVDRGLYVEEALRLVAEMEARGHKQTYWATVVPTRWSSERGG